MPTLLLVEDNLHIQRIFQDKLQREGFRVTTADDGVAGLGRAVEIHPDVILLDIMLPKMDGFQVLTKLREDPALCNIPVFILSNRGTPNDVQHATSLGARHFFAKGTCKLQDIVLHLRAACGLKKILLFTSSPQAAAPITTAVNHPQVLCSVVTVLLETVGAAERGAPDLIILDGRAPNAFTLLQQLKTNPQTKTVALIAIRDHTQTQHRLDEFIDSDRIGTDLRSLVLKRLGLAEPAVTTPPHPESASAAA
ncbi:MAG: response regulator [Verrucomicrobiia bacterium]|jgi:DNA-binding response OmpR family regulator